MALNPRYVTAPNLQCYFVDRDSGLPLSGGLIFTYRDTNRTTPKEVFELQGNQANYTYAPLPNPIVLSAAGTIVDNNYNDIIPYWYPFDDEGNLDLYYIVVQNHLGVDQFVRQAWPNPNGADLIADQNITNYVPNGQYREHISLPADTTPPYLLQPGINIIAQGGFYIKLDDNATSTNTLQFLTQPYTLNPPQSPRFVANWICSTPNSVEVTKVHEVRFGDVNKFSAPPGPLGIYTLGFWGEATSTIPFSVQVFKYFGTGGNPTVLDPIPVATGELTTGGQYFNFDIDFGSNAGYVLGTNNDDYIAIEISVPTSALFNISFADWALVPFVDVLEGFPVQTDADMMARGVLGWADTIKPDGSQLYLPPILTAYGMTWDTSQISRIGWTMTNPLSPLSTTPIPQNNMMPFSGTSYITADSASNGIPFARLQKFLVASSPLPEQGLPSWGTGPDFVSALIENSGAVGPAGQNLRITFNVAGTGSTQATEGSLTGFTFNTGYVYNGSTTGTASLGTTASNTGIAHTLLVKTTTQNGTVFFTVFSAGTSGFTMSTNLLTTQNGGSGTIATVSGAALVTAGAGKYISINITGGTQQNYWFNVDNANTPPGALAGVLNEIKISGTWTSQDVADVLREVISGYNTTYITTVGSPPDGSYFFFYANPSSLVKYYVWMAYNNATVDPKPAGAVGIRAALPASPSAIVVRDAIRGAVNAYQFYIPYLGGVFFRAVDPNGQFDFDAAYRWSYTAGVGGAVVGTYEYQQFLSHNHAISPTTVYTNSSSAPTNYATSNPNPSKVVDNVIANSGGTENRPTNMALFPYILY